MWANWREGGGEKGKKQEEKEEGRGGGGREGATWNTRTHVHIQSYASRHVKWLSQNKNS